MLSRKMVLFKFYVLVLVFLNANCVLSLPEDVEHLREHFFANLVEENRPYLKSELTDEIQRSIDKKVEAFMSTISEPTARKRRNSNDLLLNEKPIDVTVLKGFEPRGTVPVNFPQDICMFRIHEKTFAVSLSYGKAKTENENPVNVLSIFRRVNGTFQKIHEYKSKYLTQIDCSANENVGYVAVVKNINSEVPPEELVKLASFVYRIKMNPKTEKVDIQTMQTFAEAEQLAVRLYARSKNLYLVYTFNTNSKSPLNKCTVFKLAGNNFNPVDTLPCQNARVIEFFTVNHDLMVLVGNYRENNGTTNAFSSIMRYDLETRKFVEHQKIYTNAITVGKYFYLEHQTKRQHFIFIGNSFEINEFGAINYNVLSLVYKYVDGFFIPLQTIDAMHVQAVAPVMGKNNDFHLLIACEDREAQIYYYDGWKFLESTLDFTGYSFSSGVNSIRSYDDIIRETTTIVISNVNAFGNQWNNVFTPLYIVRSDTSNWKTSITNWCKNAFAQLQNFNVEEADELLNAAINLTDSSNEFANLKGKISISNSTVKSLNARQFMKKDLSVFNRINIDRINSMAQRYKKLQRNVKKLKSKIEFTTSTARVRRQTAEDNDPLINTLHVRNSINFRTINGHPISSLVYASSERNKALKSVVANEVLMQKELLVEGKIDGIEMSESNLILNTPHQILRNLTVERLSVNRLQTNSFNEMPFNDFFKMLRRKVDKKMPNAIKQLDVEELSIGGLINGKNFTDLSLNSLKTSGNQLITGELKVDNLLADGIMFKKDARFEAISGVPVSHLLDITDPLKPVQIHQDIQFTEDVRAKSLFIHERLSNVNVRDGRIQVLRRRGVDEQVVTAEKSFRSVNLKEPIMLSGKIESRTLDKMNPTAVVDRELFLEGDYVITGPVTIRRNLNATQNILTKNERLSLRKLSETGLNLFTSGGTNLRLKFKNLTEVAGNFDAKSINGKDVNSFVKTNYEGEQVVTGLKTFENGLNVINGMVEAAIINDINLEELNATILKRHAQYTQFVDGNIEFADLSVEKIISPSIKVGEKELNEILSTSKSQNLRNLKVGFIRAPQLFVHSMEQMAGGKIFGKDLNFLIDDSISVNSIDDSFIATKTFTNLYVDQLEFSEENEWKSIIGNFNSRIVQEFNVSSNYVFNRPLRIGNLEVRGKINGILYEDMKKYWMQVEGEQVFTAPQTFRTLKIDKNLELRSGRINDIDLDQMMAESVWIDESEMTIESLEIDGTLAVSDEIKFVSINGDLFEDKILKNNTVEYQKLGKVKILNDAYLRELRFKELNGIDVEEFKNAFNGNEGAVNLTVNGVVNFVRVNVDTLNGEDLRSLAENAWLSNNNVTLTGRRVHFHDESFIQGILYANRINGLDTDWVGQNYFSKSRMDMIHSHINVIGDVYASRAFYTEKIIVPKFIILYLGPLNFTTFVDNILRHDTPQHIKGNWSINQLSLRGDFDGLINGLNIRKDVLHSKNIHTATITGHKHFSLLEARDVVTEFVNGINLEDWFENHVQLIPQMDRMGSEAISVVIEHPITFRGEVTIHDDLDVRGAVNGVVIRPDTILTKSADNQVISGDLTINTINAQTHEVKPAFIESLRLKSTMNGLNWNEFMRNVFTKGAPYINSKRLVFEQTLEMDSAWTNRSIYGTDIGEFLHGSSLSNDMNKFKSNMEHLTDVCDDLMRSLNDSVLELSHYEHHQSLTGKNVQSTVLFSIEKSDGYEYALAVHERAEAEMINFYHWNREEQMFVRDENKLKMLEFNGDVYRITQFHKIVYGGSDKLYVELFDDLNQKFNHYLMHYEPSLRKFLPFIQQVDDMSMKVFTWRNGSDPCYGAIYQSFENIRVVCDKRPQIVIHTRPIRRISSHGDILIMLTDDDVIRVRHNAMFYNVPMTINPRSFASIRYNNKIYLAVQSDRAEGTVHHGYINIFESPVHEMNFRHLQRLSHNIPIDVKFSRAPSGDLMLYVLTRNPTKALSVYSYAGSSNFVEIIEDTTIVSEASDLDVIQIDDRTEMLSVVSRDIVYIIQAVLVEY